jgi:hypothetical protein
MKELKLRSDRCQICRHSERTRIELMRASGVSLDANPFTGDPFDPSERYDPHEVKLR